MATIKVRLPDGSLQAMSHPDDWSQTQVEDAIYKNFPMNSPAKVANESESTGWGGIASDVGQDIMDIPGQVGGFLTQLPGEAVAAGQQIKSNPLRAGENAIAGLLESGKGVLNIPAKLAIYLRSKGVGNPETEDVVAKTLIGDTGLEKSVLGEPQAGDALLRGVAGFTPFGKLGGLGKGLTGTARRAGAAGAYAGSQGQDPISGALMGAGIEGLGKGLAAAPSAVGKLRPTEMFKGNLSPEELRANLRAARGTSTPLGKILEEPNLNYAYENVISNTPFSGAKTSLNNLRGQVEGKATDLLSGIEPPNAGGDTNDLVKALLTSAYKESKTRKNEVYKERDRIAQEEGHILKMPEFNKLARETASSLDDSPLFQMDPEFKRTFNKMRGFDEASKESTEHLDPLSAMYSKKQTPPSLTEATVTYSTLLDQAKKFKRSPGAKDRSLGALYERLGLALKRDVDNSIKNTGSEELQQAHSLAKTNFRENFVPFLDDNIHKLLQEDKDPQAIVREIIKPGAKQDRYRDIEKVMKLLPQEQKSLLGYTYLKGAEDKLGKINPKDLAALIKSLGKRQFESLFPDQASREQLLDYGNLRGMNERALNVNFNPKTGAEHTMTGIAAIQGGLGATLGPVAGLSPTFIARYLNNKLTSEPYREKFINKVIKNKEKGSK